MGNKFSSIGNNGGGGGGGGGGGSGGRPDGGRRHRVVHHHHHHHQTATDLQPVNHKPLLMPSNWTGSDVLYVRVNAVREMIEELGIGYVMRTIIKFLGCQIGNCKCKGGLITGEVTDSYNWSESVCGRSGCNHLLSDHMLFLSDVSTFEFTALLKLVFDIINIKGTLENESRKPKLERNIVLEDVFNAIYGKLSSCVDVGEFMSFDVENIYGTPPFEDTNIDQALMNFCMHTFGNNSSELKKSLIVTKFVLRYFDSWAWVKPKELPSSNPRQFSNSYAHYYRRYMVYCCLPRCVQSISNRYRTSKIFGQDVLKYLFKVFRMELHSWCDEECITWSDHTKLLLLDHLPRYMELLEKEIYAVKSPIWEDNYELSDIKRMLIQTAPRNSIRNRVEIQPLGVRMTSMRDL